MLCFICRFDIINQQIIFENWEKMKMSTKKVIKPTLKGPVRRQDAREIQQRFVHENAEIRKSTEPASSSTSPRPGKGSSKGGV